MSNKSLSIAEAIAIDNLSPGNQVYDVGTRMKTLYDELGIIGTSYYCDPANGSDGNDGLSVETAVKSLLAAYNKCTANKNDVVYLIGNNGSINLSATLTWAKNYTHLIGICSPVGVGGRARIFQTASATGVSPLINVTASGCIFKNIYVFHGVNDATSKICLQVTGQRNYFFNCHFAGVGHTTMDVAGACSVKIDGGAENLFEKCFIGLDTVARAQNSTELWLDTAATRNRFEDCMIYAYISNAGHALVTIEDGTAIDRYLIFKDCMFMTDSTNQATSLTSVFNIKAGIVQGKIVLKNCMMLTDGASGTGDWDSDNRGILFNDKVAPAASAAGGVATKQ